MAETLITTRFDGDVALITMARPEKRNALDLAMLQDLYRACDVIEANSAIRVTILTGSGKAFSAGGDIAAWGAMQPQQFGHQWVRFGHRVFERLANLRMPLIAALNGYALGGGLELAAAADFRIAASDITIGMPETALAMVPGWSGTQRLVHRFGAQIIRRMVLGGEILTAQQALDHGIVDQVVPAGTALAHAQAYAQTIAQRGPAALEIAKMMIAIANGEDNGSAAETLGSILVAKTADLAEGLAAFRGKRPAQFKGEW